MKRALWVDDDGSDRFLYELCVLEEHDVTTDWAINAAEAVTALSTGDFWDLTSSCRLEQIYPAPKRLLPLFAWLLPTRVLSSVGISLEFQLAESMRRLSCGTFWHLPSTFVT
jgi:hypothetical protein